MQTAYRSETTPIGYFGGSGGGFPIFDVSTAKASKISAKSADFINQIFYHFRQKNEQEKSRLLLILNRLSQAKRRNQIEDIVLDLGILLEMLLLTDNEKDQLSLQFRLRGSWLLGKSFADRQEKSDTLKNIYNARSAVAHTGVLFRNKPSKLATLHAQLPNFFKLAEEILEKIVINGTPDWQNLILGSSTK